MLRTVTVAFAMLLTWPVLSADAVPALLDDAEKMAASGKWDAAVALYRDALKESDSIPVRRSYARALEARGLALQKSVGPKLAAKKKEVEQQMDKAYVVTSVSTQASAYTNMHRMGAHSSSPDQKIRKFNPDYPPLVKAQAEYKELQSQADQANSKFSDAITQYKAILRMAPNNKDYDASAHIAICTAMNTNTQSQGKQMLITFLKQNNPTTGEEKKLYAECTALVDVLSKVH